MNKSNNNNYNQLNNILEMFNEVKCSDPTWGINVTDFSVWLKIEGYTINNENPIDFIDRTYTVDTTDPHRYIVSNNNITITKQQ